jgi:hypothetical protein
LQQLFNIHLALTFAALFFYYSCVAADETTVSLYVLSHLKHTNKKVKSKNDKFRNSLYLAWEKPEIRFTQRSHGCCAKTVKSGSGAVEKGEIASSLRSSQ